MEGEVRRPGSGSGAPDQAASGGVHEAEATGCGADAGQDHAAGCAAKKVVKPSRRRPLVEHLQTSYRASERHVCEILEIGRTMYRYEGHKEQWIELRMRMREIAQRRVRYGYRMIRVLLNREGWKVGKDLVYRLYKEEGLGLRKRPAGRRRAVVHRQERFRPTGPNQVWAMDFVTDQLSDGRRFRSLTVVDIYTRESLAIESGQNAWIRTGSLRYPKQSRSSKHGDRNTM